MSGQQAQYVEERELDTLRVRVGSAQEKTQLVQWMNEEVHRRVLTAIIMMLPPEATFELRGLTDASDTQQLKGIMKYIPNLEQVIQREIQWVKREVERKY